SPHTTFNAATQGALGTKPHTYADNGSYTVKVKVTDKDGGYGSATFKVNVANVAPSLTGQADQASNEGENHSFSLGSFSDPGADSPWAVSVDWGDGSPSTSFQITGSGPAAGTSLGSQSHSYLQDGSYTVTVTVTDKNSGSGQA